MHRKLSSKILMGYAFFAFCNAQCSQGRMEGKVVTVPDTWFEAAKADNDEGLEDIKKYVDEYGGAVNKYGYTALMKAADAGNTKCVEVLAKKEANMKDNMGNTALTFAAKNGHIECVRILVEYEDCFHVNNNGETALFLATQNSDVRNMISAEYITLKRLSIQKLEAEKSAPLKEYELTGQLPQLEQYTQSERCMKNTGNQRKNHEQYTKSKRRNAR